MSVSRQTTGESAGRCGGEDRPSPSGSLGSFTWLLVITSVVVYAIVFGLWFEQNRFILFWDQTYPLNAAHSISNAITSWDRTQPFGSANLTGHALLPFFGVVFVIDHLLQNGPIAQAFIYASIIDASVIGWTLIIRLILIVELHPARYCGVNLASFCGGVFATCNTYALFYEWRIVNTDIFLQAALPWLLFCGYAVCRRDSPTKRRRRTALVGFVAASILAGTGLSNPLMIPVALLPSICVIGALYRSVRWRPAILLSCTAVIIQAYWVVPVLLAPTTVQLGASYGGQYSALVSNSSHLTPLNVLRFTGMLPVWEHYRGEPDYSWAHIYAGGGIWALFVLLPLILWIVIAYGAFSCRHIRRRLSFVLAIVIVAFLLASGTNGLSGALYRAAYRTIPFFSGYRDPYLEWGFALVTTFAILLSCGVAGTFEAMAGMWRGRAWSRLETDRPYRSDGRLGRVVVCGLCVLATLGYGWPLVTGGVIRSAGPVRPSAHVELPGALLAVSRYLQTYDTHGWATLALPTQGTPLESEIWKSGYVGLDPLQELSGKPVLSVLLGRRSEQTALLQLVNELAGSDPAATALASALGVHFVLFRWDNNYHFGGLQSRSQMRRIEGWLVGKRLAVPVVQSGRMTLLRLMAIESGPALSMTVSKIQNGRHVVISAGVNQVNPSDGKKMIKYIELPPTGALAGIQLRSIDPMALGLVSTLHSRGPVEVYFAGAQYTAGRYRRGSQWFPYAAEGACRMKSSGWVVVDGTCTAAFSIASVDVTNSYPYDMVEMVSRSDIPTPTFISAKNIVVTTAVKSVSGYLSHIGPDVGAVIDAAVGKSQGVPMLTAAPNGVTRASLGGRTGLFAIVLPQLFNTELSVKVETVVAGHADTVRCADHVRVDGFLDGWLCSNPRRDRGGSAGRLNVVVRVVDGILP